MKEITTLYLHTKVKCEYNIKKDMANETIARA